MASLLFCDLAGWDYDVDTPYKRPLGGSQSALCYLTEALAQRGHQVRLLTATTSPRVARGVECISTANVPRDLAGAKHQAMFVLNGPAEASLQLRPLLSRETPLLLWTQHAVNQPAMEPLDQPEVRQAWDGIVCVSEWHRQTMLQRFPLRPDRVWVQRNAVGPAFARLFGSPEEIVEAKQGGLDLAYTSTPFRGLDVLLTLYPLVHEALPSTSLQVFSSMQVYQKAAPDDPYGRLYELCRTTPGVDYRGSVPQPELAAALRGAAVLAYPNTFAETSCIAVMEAIAAGLVVVTSELGALPETCGGYAVLVPPVSQLGAQEYARQYLNALLEVLRAWEANPDQAARARWQQIDWIQRTCTWAVRAAEWEQMLGIASS